MERKELAQKTKDFRKFDDPAKLVEIKGLLKAYQSYIDLITNHNKAASSSFLKLYSSLSEAPDPYPILDASVDSLVIADEKVPRLEAENEHLQSRASKLTSQLETSEKQLGESNTARQELQESVDQRISDVEQSWSAVLSEKQDNWSAREQTLEERCENQERLIKELKASYEVSQRLDQGDDSGAQEGNAAELEMLNSDLDRVNQRLADVEARNEQLRVELAQAATEKGSATKNLPAEEDPVYLRLRSENSSLLRRVEAAKYEKESKEREAESSLRTFKREIVALKADADNLRQKTQKWQDYDEVKRELEVLKSIEFATGDADEPPEPDTASKEVSTGNTENLEQLLLARNKKLNNELTVLRVTHQDLASRLESLQEELSITNKELEKARSLNATLENDISRVQREASSSHPAMSVAGTINSKYPSFSRRGRASPTSSIISGFDSSGGPSQNNFDAWRAGESGGSGILPMMTAQRDRFKKRNNELETDLSKSYDTISTLRSEIASLQKDNLNLYEKTRYVSTYNRSQPATSGSSYSMNPGPSAIQLSDNNAPLDRYQSAYETRISPFAAFRGRESARALKRMSIPERFIFKVTRIILATRISRNLFALYCFGLHFLVLGMLYHLGSVEMENSPHLAGSDAFVKGDTGNSWQQDTFHDNG